MELTHISYTGLTIDDEDILARLPANLSGILRQLNGFLQYAGGLHVRGACLQPAWHSLRDAWDGESAFHRHYPTVSPDDIPFAEDCLGDQFLLRNERVIRLSAETGEVSDLGLDLRGFLEAVAADPVEFLSLQPLLQFHQEDGHLEPGQLLAAHPPYCTAESAKGVHLAAIGTEERRRFLAELAAQIRDVPEGGAIRFSIDE